MKESRIPKSLLNGNIVSVRIRGRLGKRRLQDVEQDADRWMEN